MTAVMASPATGSPQGWPKATAISPASAPVEDSASSQECRAWAPGYLKVSYHKRQVKDAPCIGTEGEQPAGDEEAIFKHYG